MVATSLSSSGLGPNLDGGHEPLFVRVRVKPRWWPRKLSFKACNRFSIAHTTGIYRWRLSTWCPTPSPTSPLLPFSPFGAIARNPLNPAALAFVPFGIVLVRVRVVPLITALVNHPNKGSLGASGRWSQKGLYHVY